MLLLTAALAGCASSPSSLNRGVALYRDGNYVEAREAFYTAVRLRPDSAAAYVDRGAARVRTGDVSGGLADYTRALELSPLDPDIYYNRGNAYMLLGRPVEAIADYTRAVELRPMAAAFFNRGTARAYSDLPGARADWAYAAAIEPDPAVRTMMALNTPPDTTVVVAAPAVVGSDTLSASPPTLSSMDVPPSPAVIDARALATRGVAREIDGDHEGARADLGTALALETDVARREAIERLLRFLDTAR
jgi:tetratricopeptide (TPR) repeat protein